MFDTATGVSKPALKLDPVEELGGRGQGFREDCRRRSAEARHVPEVRHAVEATGGFHTAA